MKYFFQSTLLFLSIFLFAQCDKSSSNLASSNASTTKGKAGSLARFAIIENYLYAIDNQSLRVFDVTNPSAILFKNTMYVGSSIETIFPFRNKLFIASNIGMYMYDVSNPVLPTRESFVQHFTGCDPVVANNTHAYLTIRSGSTCGSNNNLNVLKTYRLDNNIANPTFVSQVDLRNPIGLGLKNKTLFVADKIMGLVVFDVSDGDHPIQKQVITGEKFIDVIVYDNLLVCMLEDGIAYYNITDVNNISKLSTLK
jgi:hypothetical protein